ncbi:MurR/RpiR family transcriptional regulator [Pseudoroseomonas wenyumeiae]
MAAEAAIRASYDAMSPALRLTARWVLANPGQVATRPLHELARLSGQSAASFIRLAKRLGHPGWAGLQEEIAVRLREDGRRAAFADRLAAGATEGPREEVLQVEWANLKVSFGASNAPVIAEAVNRMLRARRIAIVGRRSCSGAAAWLHYLLRVTTPKAVLADDRGGAFGLDLIDLEEGDVLIAIGFMPCSVETVAAVRHARKVGAWTLGFVDAPLGALSRATDQQIVVGAASGAFFDSMVGTMAAIQWLAASWVERIGRSATDRAKAHRDLMSATGAFDAEDLSEHAEGH